MKKKISAILISLVMVILAGGYLSSTRPDFVQAGTNGGGGPLVSIVKYTNGQIANDPNGTDVPYLSPGAAVEWTYKVTNTGDVAVASSDVIVTDDQNGITPVFDHEISGNGDSSFDPGEIWEYKALGIAVDLKLPPAGLKVIQGACTMKGTRQPSPAYVNIGSVSIPGASSLAQSSYCNPLYKLYFPLIFSPPSIFNQDWHVSVGFEDLPLVTGQNDYDFNDWITDIEGTAIFDHSVNNGLREMVFNFNPHARGAAFDHTFHLAIPHGTFGSNGTAVLSLYNKDHVLLNSQTSPFVASADSDFVIFSKTSVVFPGSIVNTIENIPFIPPQLFATLDITFIDPAPFNLSSYDLGASHGEGLFFDPYLHVLNTDENVKRGDIRMLTVPDTTYLWPEEGIRIDKAYSGVTFIPTNPPTILFPSLWWLSHNHCVYDGSPCILPNGLTPKPSIQSTLTVTPP